MNSAINQSIRNRIFNRAEEDYKKFQSGLIPGEDRILGVRMPHLRELTKYRVDQESKAIIC